METYKIEIEYPDGKTRLSNVSFVSLNVAETECEKYWLKYSGTDTLARVSVLDPEGNRVTDWEF